MYVFGQSSTFMTGFGLSLQEPFIRCYEKRKTHFSRGTAPYMCRRRFRIAWACTRVTKLKFGCVLT